ncbi:MAG: tetratricopeptide repeat protein [Gemmatimonadaceae bacterium]|nr:tetratricopeptide repeat protein [Gemmatimonadaceae bacterium]
MSNIAKLKKQAAEFEHKRQFDKALAKYVQILHEMDEHVEEADVALYNRVGDLVLRQGNVAEAVGYYEKAVDLYADAGFFNNAIALCNKILRNTPGRSIIYYKLGKISAQKGFTNDAKQNFLEYAGRMQRAGQLNEAFRALTEFADLCPDQDDIRLMLADQLVREDRKSEAIHQLQTLYEKYHADGRANDAHATLDRMKAIDPSIEPRRGVNMLSPKASELVFLDLQYSNPATTADNADTKSVRHVEPERPVVIADDLALIQPDFLLEATPLPGIEHGASLSAEELDASFGGELPLLALDRDTFESIDDQPDVLQLVGLEPTSAVDAEVSLNSGGVDTNTPGSNEFEIAETSFSFDAELEPWNSDDLPLIPVNEPMSSPPAGGDPSYLGDEPLMSIPSLEIETEWDAAELNAPAQGEVVSKPVEFFEAASDGLDDSFIMDGTLEEPTAPLSATDLHALPLAADTRSEAILDRLLDEPRNWLLHRQAGEALLEEGAREQGMHELDVSMAGFEEDGNLVEARALVDEILRLEPDSVRYHQKRVEYAFRMNDRARLVTAYVELADSLLRSGDLDKARSVYGRVIELAPDDPRAQDALDATFTPESQPVISEPVKLSQTPPAEAAPVVPAPDRMAPSPEKKTRAGSDDYVNLSDWLREDETPKSTRMVAEGVSEPVDNQQADFAEMLERFKQGVALNIDESDHQSHFDLGIAYREMGLVDEAIAQFQKALRSPGHRVRTYEALGQCFVDKKQFQIASTLLSRAVADRTQSDEDLVGVLYLLGLASEQLQRWDDARKSYERVFAVDIQFQDVGERLVAMESAGR